MTGSVAIQDRPKSALRGALLLDPFKARGLVLIVPSTVACATPKKIAMTVVTGYFGKGRQTEVLRTLSLM